MKNGLGYLKNEKVFWFLSGAAALIFGSKILKSDSTRKACIGTMAKAMKFQGDAQEVFQNMKEDAQDLCYDAKQEVNSQNSDKFTEE